jgi:hypothetical protein
LLYPLIKQQTPTEEGKVRTDAQTLRGNEMDMGKVKAWAQRTFSKERIQEVALCVATVSAIGTVLFSLHRAMESCVIMGF